MPRSSILMLAAVLGLGCGPTAVPPPSRSPAPLTVVPSPTRVATDPTILWTSPPVAQRPATETPTPSPPAVEVPAPAPLRTATPAATPRPTVTPSPDPFRWTAYEVSGGPVVSVPATWTVVEPAVLRGAFAFAASPEGPRASLAMYVALLTMDWASVTPALTLDRFADAYQSAIVTFHPVRERGAHPSGPAWFFTYRDPAGFQHVDAIVAAGGRIATLRLRAPVDRWAPYAATFQQIFQRFRLG